MIPTVQKTIATRCPRMRGRRILVAASGGADSTALAYILHHLGYPLALAHLHHGIRGRPADGDARFAANLANKLGVPLYSAKEDVPSAAKASGESLEMAARRLRRQFLLTTARRHRFRYIAVGHNADDQAETVLMRIIRGTSVTGLVGIPYLVEQDGLFFVRPLRDCTRAQIIAYLKKNRFRWREDATNADDFSQRNRVRHEILPLLEARLNSAARQALLRLADIAAAEDEVMSALARTTPPSARAPLAIRRRQAVAEMQRAGVPPGQQVFHAVENFFPQRGKKGANFPCVGKVVPKFSMRWIQPLAVPTMEKSSPTAVRTGGASAAGLAVVGGDGSGAPQVTIRRGRGFSRRTDEVCLSAAAVGGRDLLFRSWRAGDRMKPLGMSGSKKLSDIFTDLKVPAAERNAWVVVECGGEVVALAGWRVARDFAVERARAPSLRITWQGVGGPD